MKTWVWLGLLFLLLLPTFSLMLRPGIYTMHDPHVFRVYEFDKCIKDGVFPCRWAPDSGKGYGEPLFNFYAQGPYLLTQLFRTFNFSILDSTKFAFIFTLLASGASMYLLASRYWGRRGGLVWALFYVYAPYRAVDVWVRGALPEALAFVWYPLILWSLDKFLITKKSVFCFLFSVFLAALLLTHNLSFLMFFPFLSVWVVYQLVTRKQLFSVRYLLFASFFALLLSAFYLLPVLFESHLVTLDKTITDYYDFHVHFTTLKELFISRYWGYGASLWAQKFLSVSIGHLHWLIPTIIFFFVWVKKRSAVFRFPFSVFFLLGFLALFLTHGKSSLIWNLIGPMKYIQFPWRFLTIAVFFLSLSAGLVSTLLPKKFITVNLINLIILVNFSFFRPDIWRSITDAEQFSGPLWDEGRSTSLSDFWPKSAPNLPSDFSSHAMTFLQGSGYVVSQTNRSHSATYEFEVTTATSHLQFPIVYFPGWQVYTAGVLVPVQVAADSGLITVNLARGRHVVNLEFVNTIPRSLGNAISFISLCLLPLWLSRKKLG